MKQKAFFIVFEGLSFGEKEKKRTQALSTEQIIEDLTILFKVSDVPGDRLQGNQFPSEKEIISPLTDSRQNIPEDIADAEQLKQANHLKQFGTKTMKNDTGVLHFIMLSAMLKIISLLIIRWNI